MLTRPDAPKTLRFADEQTARVARLAAPHVAPLEAFARRVRDVAPAGASVPSFDPCDGGVAAEALFLLEAPGPRAVATGFVSRNNPDETAKNVFDLQREAGLSRERVALWNVVPWYIGTGDRIRPATRVDVAEGAPYLGALFQLLPRLKILVLVGGAAARAEGALPPGACRVLRSPHPSPVPMRPRPETRERILAVWREAASMLA